MKTNTVDLSGYLISNPLVVPANGENDSKIIMHLMTARGTRDTGDGNFSIIKTNIPVLSKDPKIVEIAGDFQQFDFVRIKCVLTTASKEKTSKCPACEEPYTDTKLISYVEPIYVERIEKCGTEEKANECLIKHLEVSQEVRLIGHVMFEPISIKNSKGKDICQYQLGVARTYRIHGSRDEEKSDFPWVKSFGKNARDDIKRLKVGTGVLIDGALQSRSVEKIVKCEHCGREFKLEERLLLEVVPYESEYLTNYVTDAEIEEDQESA